MEFDYLIEQFNAKIAKTPMHFRRNLAVHWEDRLIGLVGARGVGKTTHLLQHLKVNYAGNQFVLYCSLDDVFFATRSLVSLADEWVKRGGKLLVLDEIHKYPNWSQELKNIYDRYPELKVIFTGSSALHIHEGNADLSRRAVVYHLEGLSFREFLNIQARLKLPVVSINDLLERHSEIARDIVSQVRPLAYFDQYLQYGYYPYFLESTQTYHRKLWATIQLMLEVDLPYLRHVEIKYVHKLRKLIGLVANALPYQPNVSKLASDVEVSRNTVMLYLNYLEECRVLNLLRSKASSEAVLAKPEKVYLHHPNLMYAIVQQGINASTVRESFFYNQLANVHQVSYTKQGDFLVNGEITFEVGGQNKSKKQLKGLSDAYIAADMIEYGFERKVPLWLFGFLY